MQWYGANIGNPQVINYLLAARRVCGDRTIRQNPIVCCDRPLSAVVPPPTTQVAITPPAEGSEPWRQMRITTTTTARPQLENNGRVNAVPCNDPKGMSGVCRNIRECPHILQQFVARQTDPQYIEYIRESNGLCNYVQPYICCTKEEAAPVPQGPTTVEPIQGRLLSPQEGCGDSNSTLTRVVGGQPAKKGAWPWMALIGYTNDLSGLTWKCGGTLITTRHVLTAAHCIKATL